MHALLQRVNGMTMRGGSRQWKQMLTNSGLDTLHVSRSVPHITVHPVTKKKTLRRDLLTCETGSLRYVLGFVHPADKMRAKMTADPFEPRAKVKPNNPENVTQEFRHMVAQQLLQEGGRGDAEAASLQLPILQLVIDTGCEIVVQKRASRDFARGAHPLHAFPVDLLQDDAEEISIDKFTNICLSGDLGIAIALDKLAEDENAIRFLGQTIHGVCPNPTFYN